MILKHTNDNVVTLLPMSLDQVLSLGVQLEAWPKAQYLKESEAQLLK